MSGNYLALGLLDPDIRRAWAIHPIGNERAHYYHRSDTSPEGGNLVTTACGLLSAEGGPFRLLVPGNYPRCRRCISALPVSLRY